MTNKSCFILSKVVAYNYREPIIILGTSSGPSYSLGLRGLCLVAILSSSLTRTPPSILYIIAAETGVLMVNYNRASRYM